MTGRLAKAMGRFSTLQQRSRAAAEQPLGACAERGPCCAALFVSRWHRSARPCRLDARSERQLSLCSSKRPPTRRAHSTRLVNVIPHTAHRTRRSASPSCPIGPSVCAALRLALRLSLLGSSGARRCRFIWAARSHCTCKRMHALQSISFFGEASGPKGRVDPTLQLRSCQSARSLRSLAATCQSAHPSMLVIPALVHNFSTWLAPPPSSLPYIYRACLASRLSSIITPSRLDTIRGALPPFTPLRSLLPYRPPFPASDLP